MTAAAAAITAAQNFIGCREKDGSHKKIIDLYNSQKPLPRGYKMKYTDPWCAAFVSAVGVKLGISHILLPECGVGDMMRLYKAKNRFRGNAYTPKAGDLIVYDWGGDGKGDHIGIIERCCGGKITVIEGNYQDGVGRREISSESKSILGYCVPDYDEVSGKIDSVEKVQY